MDVDATPVLVTVVVLLAAALSVALYQLQQLARLTPQTVAAVEPEAPMSLESNPDYVLVLQVRAKHLSDKRGDCAKMGCRSKYPCLTVQVADALAARLEKVAC